MSTTAQTHAARAMAYAFARNVASMQAAYIEWTRGDGADHGMAWIGNTLCGPGLLPGAGNTTAQEFFDCEMEKLDKLYPDVTMNPALPSPAWCASVDAELAATAEVDGAYECETCQGSGEIDETLGGYPWSNPHAECPDCEGDGVFFRRITLPAAAVAEGAQLDGESLEQGESS